jgi:ADP-L-glycero-D-manno-heptose 6-epimerase
MSNNASMPNPNNKPTLVITGAAGFVGSCLLAEYARKHTHHLVAVDDFSIERKQDNFIHASQVEFIDRSLFIDWFRQHATQVEAVLHIGARTNTTEQDLALLDRLNLNYSIHIWEICTTHQIPLVYASSAATYGNGEYGYSDDHALIPSLKPMNPYGQSKRDFDLWALAQEKTPPFWAGLKFFNVYGPNEYHKGRMASVVMHTFNQIQATGTMSLFKSHRADVADGYQSRDFVYVKDVVNVIVFLLEQQPNSAIYNLGSGEANPFFDLARFTFEAMGKEPQISFIDTPIDIRETYQYYTCAGMSKLRESGYTKAFYTLKEGVFDYVQQYLLPHAYY